MHVFLHRSVTSQLRGTTALIYRTKYLHLHHHHTVACLKGAVSQKESINYGGERCGIVCLEKLQKQSQIKELWVENKGDSSNFSMLFCNLTGFLRKKHEKNTFFKTTFLDISIIISFPFIRPYITLLFLDVLNIIHRLENPTNHASRSFWIILKNRKFFLFLIK